jgi:ATP-dependent exoDNAse (exonuclease V) beta subunit
VQVQTVHGSKGLEYPVVVFAQTDWTHPVEAFDVETVGRDGPLDLTDPLAGRWIRYWPWPYGDLKKVEGLDARIGQMPEHGRWEAAARGEAIRLLYVGLTRARDALVLPTTLKKGLDRPFHPWLDLVFGGPDVAGEREVWLTAEPGARTVALTRTQRSVTIVTEPPVEALGGSAPAVHEMDWFRPPMEGEPLPAAHRAVSGLTLPPGETVATAEPLQVGPPLAHAAGLPWAELGTALHAVLAADELDRPAEERRARAAALLASHCPAAPRAVLPEELLERSRQLSDTLTRTHGPGRWLREWPVRLALDGVTASGWIDLAVETAAGWVLVDHKSFPGLAREEWAAKAAAYAAQLAAYAFALEAATQKPVLAAYVHLVVGGALVPVILPGGDPLRRLVAGSLRA